MVHVCIQLFYFSDLKLRIKSFKNGLLMRWKIQHVSLKCLSYSAHPYPVYRIYNQKQFPIIALFLFDEPKIFLFKMHWWRNRINIFSESCFCIIQYIKKSSMGIIKRFIDIKYLASKYENIFTEKNYRINQSMIDYKHAVS